MSAACASMCRKSRRARGAGRWPARTGCGVPAVAILFRCRGGGRSGIRPRLRARNFGDDGRLEQSMAERSPTRAPSLGPRSQRCGCGRAKAVFPGRAHGDPLSDVALLRPLKRMNSGARIDPARGKRSTVSGRPSGRGPRRSRRPPNDVVEQAMGHQVGTVVERAYRRTDILEKRRALMEDWAQWCEPKAGNVIAGRSSR